ncbi:hypothetical protein PN499_17370 [Kamptonema animale CS-326]|jgi:hypothetical protein|uniref:hypothetical protein n=1 Tax=Kamptonema animale TaxID=92934 RepID=UPI00232B5A42|nr:hypothetical protein [Kamptonema animale]MDB9512964.1 hypothetical protein [Kamptonema animale CS-326]
MLAVTEEVFKFGSVPEAAIRIAESVIALLQSHSAQASCLKEEGLKIGERLAQVEAALGKAEFTRWLKHHFQKEIVRYFRNLTKQAQLIEKYPEL